MLVCFEIRKITLPFVSLIVPPFQDCVDWLLIKGANPNTVDRSGNTPLFAACSSGSSECVDLIVEEEGNLAALNGAL